MNFKGFLFTGCSFTWGFGLNYYYQHENKLPFEKINTTSSTPSGKFQEKNRFSNIISKHFNRWHLQKTSCSGSDGVSNHWLSKIANIFDKDLYNDELSDEENTIAKSSNPKDFDVLIYQTSFLVRNAEIYYTKMRKEDVSEFDNVEDMFEYIEDINEDYKNLNPFFERLLHIVVNEIKKICKKFEDDGVKVFFIHADNRLSWIEDSWINKRTIPLTIKGRNFYSINDLSLYLNNTTIAEDTEFFGNNPPIDYHPSLKVHNIIAKSVIKRLEDESIKRNT